MAIDQRVLDSELLQQAVLRYLESKNEQLFNELYIMVKPKLASAVTKTLIRYSRTDRAGAFAAADDALLDALARYKPDCGVPFSAFLHLVVGRKLGRYVQSLYYAGKDRDIERPVATDISTATDAQIAYTPESSVRDALQYIKTADSTLHQITYMLMNGWNDETVGRLIGGRDTAVAAKSWTCRQRAKVATILKRFQLESEH